MRLLVVNEVHVWLPQHIRGCLWQGNKLRCARRAPPRRTT